MKIIGIVGSLSKNSYNMAIVEFMKERYRDKLDIEIIDIGKLPMYTQDIENEPVHALIEYRRKIKEADGILFATPEHNHTIPAALKNAIDWLSRVEPVLVDKPSMIVGASMGALGTVKAQAHLREILNSAFVGTLNLPKNEVFIGSVHNKVDENKMLIDKGTIEYLDIVVDNFIGWINKLK